MKYLFTALGLSIAVTGIAQAQPAEQTPANAHIFLKQLSAQNRVYFEPPEYAYRIKFYSTVGYNNRYSITSREVDYTLNPLIFNLIDSAGCQTKLVQYTMNNEAYSQGASFYDSNTKLTIPGKEYWHPYVPHLQYIIGNGINWALVSAATADGAKGVTLRGPGFSGGFVKLIFESSEMATRAAYAMEVIRQSCDPVANTGF